MACGLLQPEQPLVLGEQVVALPHPKRLGMLQKVARADSVLIETTARINGQRIHRNVAAPLIGANTKAIAKEFEL